MVNDPSKKLIAMGCKKGQIYCFDESFQKVLGAVKEGGCESSSV